MGLLGSVLRLMLRDQPCPHSISLQETGQAKTVGGSERISPCCSAAPGDPGVLTSCSRASPSVWAGYISLSPPAQEGVERRD